MAFTDRTGERGQRGVIYPEITGYALSMFAGLKSVGHDLPRDEETTNQAARFLADALIHNGGSVRGTSRRTAAGVLCYTFDTGMAVKGLAACAAGTQTSIAAPLQMATEALTRTIDSTGRLAPFVVPPTLTVQPRWSTQSGPYLLKAVLGLACAMQRLHGSVSVRLPIQRAVEWAICQQTDDGFFGVVTPSHVNMHAHLYACEASCLLGTLLGVPHAVWAARSGTLAALRVFEDQGTLPPTLDSRARGAERSDTVAQLLRLCVMLDIGTSTARHALAHRLVSYQHEVTGAIRFGRDYDVTTGQVRSRMGHLSTHATLFAVQAWLGLADPCVSSQWIDQPWTFA